MVKIHDKKIDNPEQNGSAFINLQTYYTKNNIKISWFAVNFVKDIQICLNEGLHLSQRYNIS